MNLQVTPKNSRYGGDCMVVCNDWHSALVPMLIHAEKPTGPVIIL